MKLSAQASKYIICDIYVQLLELDTTVTMKREGFECTMDVAGETWKGRFESDERLTWDNGSIWVRDPELDDNENDTPDVKEWKSQARREKLRASQDRLLLSVCHRPLVKMASL